MTTFILTHKERRKSSVAMLINFMGRRYKIAVGETVPVALWNEKTKRLKIKSGSQEYASVNDSLDKWQAAAEKALKRFRDKYIIPEREELAFIVRDFRFGRNTSDDTILVNYFDVYIDRYSGIRSFNRIKHYKLVKSVLLRYQEETRCVLRFEDINMNFHNSFSRWFTSHKYSPNYLGDCLKVIRTVMRDAEEVDKLHSNRTPYSKMFTIPNVRTDNIYLTSDELIRMYRLDITDELVSSFYPELPAHKRLSMRKSLTAARDIFIIAAFTGLRFSDCVALSLENIHNGFFELYNIKTDVKTVIPIHWVIQEMLDSGYDFSVKMAEQNMNKHIKCVAMMAGIDEFVTLTRFCGKERVQVTRPKYAWISSHTARRSFATNAYLAGIPTIAIMKITGHKRESTFMEYIKVDEMENAERMRLLGFFTGKQ